MDDDDDQTRSEPGYRDAAPPGGPVSFQALVNDFDRESTGRAPQANDSSATERIANMLVLRALRANARLIRIHPGPTRRWVELMVDGGWRDEFELHEEARAAVRDQFARYAHVDSESESWGHYSVTFGPTGNPVTLRVFIRPTAGDRILLVRLLPESEVAASEPVPRAGWATRRLQRNCDKTRRLALRDAHAALRRARALVKTAQRIGPKAHLHEIDAFWILADTAFRAGSLSEASEARNATKVAVGKLEPSLRSAFFWEALADLSARASDFPEAIAAQGRAVAMTPDYLGDDDPFFADVLGRLGTYLEAGGQFDEASAAFERAARYLERLTGSDDLKVVALVDASVNARRSG